ncbi:MAG TPA: alpha/beta hydrolase [Burkholderiaceae bacterium]|nr:alpha/beta hydrolase [Burkholderiaceae bacterium]
MQTPIRVRLGLCAAQAPAREIALALATAIALAGCGGGNSSTSTPNSSSAPGALVQNPPLRIASLTATDFNAQLGSTASGQQLLAVTGAPTCGVDFHYIEYTTTGGAGESTTATGALMVPTGSAAPCTGARPMLLYAHGTSTSRAYNIADITNTQNTEGALIAAMYAAQGYIVVAPNYAGYDASPLPYHPYLNAKQQSGEMINALDAARQALGHIPAAATIDSGKLFITGYSQGGHVAMATHRAMQAAGRTVTASAPMSGPYALAALGDAVFYGDVNLGSTVFTPLLTTSYQKAYGNIYAATTDVYETTYASGIESLLPSTTPIATLFATNKLPQTALFNSTPPAAAFASITPPTTPAAEAALFALGFGTNNLVTNNYRLAYLADAQANPDGAVPTVTSGAPATSPGNALRQAFKANDLRGWTPTAPVLLCGGNADPTVFYAVNTGIMQQLWSALPAGLATTLDVDSAVSGATDPFAAAKLGFAQAKSATAQAAVAAGATDGGASAVVQAYHGTLVPPFCNAAARGFFSQF